MAKRRKIEADASPLTSNPFAALAERFPDAPAGDSPAPAEQPGPQREPDEPADTGASPFPARLVVRKQKKGHGGKTATYVEGLDPAQLPELLRRLKRELGCSGRVDADTLVLGTSDHRRVAQWFEREGAERVVLGN